MPEATTSERGYKAPWVTGDKNEEFWREVLVGRAIKEISFDDIGIEYLLLDDGQKLFINHKSHGAGCIFIKD
jgi:hypothetical protein